MSLAAQPRPTEIRIDSGAYDRRETVVSFTGPSVKNTFQYALRDRDTSIPVQVDATGRAWCILPELKAATSRTFRLIEAPAGNEATVTAVRNADDVAISVKGSGGGAPVVQYVGGAGALPAPEIKPTFRRGGYLHPVRTPSGRIVTDDYPADHRHHHGIWFAWTRTVFQGRAPDFWNMGDGKARVEFEALEDVWSGAVHGGLLAKHRYVDLTSGSPVTVLAEQWRTRVFAGSAAPRHHMFDVEVAQTNVTGDPLLLPEYHYGGIGVRGAASFVRLENVQFMTSEGKDRATGDGTESRWVVISGDVDGRRASLAILAHPANFRAPERMRIHPTDPYVSYAPSRSGPWVIAQGATHTARYRFVSFDGPPDAAELRRLWLDYAMPPTVHF